ncbi:SDR family oxidoreductase [Williamsia serinedens]|uniref:NAD(P)-dependent dehydrogenase, short-chain alcohol dehydrogenase family n=1 Tax=Williamsia serinedens TaxID=391736 RepID=A0ABT1GXF6_9NOCA|nr:SDR family oxidoreductase [Williamsia serinedens]MCP2159429.1 NAD(P)-dependent dehydrogenase, short-chain alcohol dehydrogenase family [Williamsia serinedens]
MARTVDITVPDLTDRRVVLTGGSDGIGLHIAARLAAAGADLVLPVRNQEKGRAAVERIRAQSPGARVALRELDLSSLSSVAALASALREEGIPVDVLLDNAGLMTPPSRQETADGFEVQFGTNHLGHVALIAGLMPLLRAGRARVVSQISVAANRGSINWADLNWERSYDGMAAYSQSKIAMGLFAVELGRRSQAQGWGITSVLAHPGVAPTSLLSARPEVGRDDDTRSVRLIRWLSARGLVVGTPQTAALPALLAATDPDAVDGTLYGPTGLGHLGGVPGTQKLYSRLESTADAARIWEESQRLVDVRFPTSAEA